MGSKRTDPKRSAQARRSDVERRQARAIKVGVQVTRSGHVRAVTA